MACILAAFLTFFLSFSIYAEEKKDDGQPVEEVIVTGSFIKKDSFDSASPLTVVDQESIANNATPNLGEILVSQTFNYGSDFQTNTYAARGQGGVSTAANLRGLGSGATLNLVNGKRHVSGYGNAGVLSRSNLANALPQVAIERIEILKDGASATYGTDAVAGVVNIIPRKNFSGAQFSAFYTQDAGDDFHEEVFDIISGTDTDNGHFTFAASYRKRNTLEQTERPEYLRKGFERSGTGNPGDWRVPTRDATGAISGARRLADPGCGVENGSGGRDVGVKNSYLSGELRRTATGDPNCNFHFGETWNFMNPAKQWSLWSNYRYDFSDNLSNDLDLIIARQTTDSRGSPQNPGGRTEEFPIVLGDHPGNPFRAFADSNGNGTLDAGEQLYAQDADGDGIPDRGTVDANGDGIMDVILSATPFSAGPNSIPFNEDVDVIALRAFGKIGLLGGANQPTSLNGDGSNTGNATYDVINYRLVDTLTYEIPDTSWEVSISGIYQSNHLVFEQKNTSQSALVQGLMGQLKADPTDSSTSYWNPFSTQALTCTDRVCSYTGTPGFANSVSVLDAVNIQTNDVSDLTFWTMEVLATGDLFDLTGGTAQLAIGAEYRRMDVDVDLNSNYNQCNWHEGGCGFDWKATEEVDSLFFELFMPLMDNLEVTIAGRNSDYGSDVGSSFDPKISILFQPTDMISLRATWSTAFIAPTLEDRYEPEDCGLETAPDLLTLDTGATFRVACVAGNPNLEPETADVFNIGVSLALLDGDLNLGIDYASYDFEDRISQTTLNQVLSLDYQAFLGAGFTAGNAADIAAWIADPRSDKAIQRDITGVVTRVTTSKLNAQQMKHVAFDYYASYDWDLDNLGHFNFRLDATQVDEYSYDLGLGIPPGDGVGMQNEDVIEIPPMPEWRLTFTTNWFKDNHSALMRIRWIDEFELDFNSKALQAGQAAINKTLTMDSIMYTDVNYKYTFDSLLGDRETTLEVGGRNIFDEMPDPIFNLGGIESYVHDIRGRMWYVRVRQDL